MDNNQESERHIAKAYIESREMPPGMIKFSFLLNVLMASFITEITKLFFRKHVGRQSVKMGNVIICSIIILIMAALIYDTNQAESAVLFVIVAAILNRAIVLRKWGVKDSHYEGDSVFGTKYAKGIIEPFMFICIGAALIDTYNYIAGTFIVIGVASWFYQLSKHTFRVTPNERIGELNEENNKSEEFKPILLD